MNRTLRRFEFFDVETINEDMTGILGSAPTCAVAEGGMLLFGDSQGNVTVCDRNFNGVERKHKLFRGEVKGLAYIYDGSAQGRQFIVAIGDDSKGASDASDGSGTGKLYVIKIFSMNDMTRPIQIINASANDSTLTSFAVLSDASQIAVGYESGTILLFTGAFLKENLQNRPAPPSILFKHKYTVSGLYFCEIQSRGSTAERRLRLFAVMNTPEPTDDKERAVAENTDDPNIAGTLIFDTSVVVNPGGSGFSVPSNRQPVRVLDGRGAQFNCASFMKGSNELMVARSEAMYTYSTEDRGGAMAIFGEKQCVSAVGRYALVVSVEERRETVAASPATIPGVPPPPVTEKPKKPNVNIYDLKSKIICGTTKKYTLQMGEKVKFVLHDGGTAYLITTAFSLIRFKEKETARKLDMLLTQCKPPLYTLAIMLAAEEQVEASEVMKLYKSYGDDLYARGEFDAAIVQYSHTVGYVPPSYVVMKFLDPYRIANLITYLEKLNEKGLASKEHNILLLTCYTKIKDDAKIKELLDNLISKYSTQHAATKDGAAVFDPAQAINTLKMAGYIDFALQVAAKCRQHDSYLTIQLSKATPQYDDALGYLAYISFISSTDDILQLLKTHGRTLLSAKPKPFTSLLSKICTGDFASILPNASQPPALSAPPSSIGYIIANKATASTELIKSVANALASGQMRVPTEAVPVVELISLFTHDKDNLLQLLESVEDTMKGRILPARLSTTLIELYLSNYSKQKEKLVAALHSKAQSNSQQSELESAVQLSESNIMKVLDSASHTQLDASQALLLVHSYGFERGERFLLERQHSIELVMRMLIESNDAKEVFKVLRREGNKDPELYVQVLTYFVQKTMDDAHSGRGAGANRGSIDSDESLEAPDDEEDDDDEDAKWGLILDVMDLIEKENILAPVQVLTILATNPKLPLSVASKYVGKTLQEMSDDIDQCENDVRGALLRLEEISQMSVAQTQLQGRPPKVERVKSRRHGDYDDDDEDDDDEDEAPVDFAESERQHWEKIRAGRIAYSANQEEFYKELELSPDGFNTVALAFGRSNIL